MKKNFFSILSASLFISSSVIAAESADGTMFASAVDYTIHPKNMSDHFVTLAPKSNANGHYLRVASFEPKNAEDRWRIIEASDAPGYFRIYKAPLSSPHAIMIYNDEKSTKGKYMQMLSSTSNTQKFQGHGLWKIKAAKKAPGYFKLVPKSLPKFFAAYSEDDKPQSGGFFMQIASYENPGNELFFSLVPQDYILTATVSNFKFSDDMETKLRAAATPDFSGVQTVKVKDKDLGAKIGGDYKKDITETFTWGLNEKLGISVQTSFKTGIPFIAEGKITLGGSFEFASNQSWINSQTRSFTAKAEMNPKKPGTYQIGNVIYIANNVLLPFTATTTYTAVSGDNPLYAKGVEALCKYNGLKSEIISRDTNSISVATRGTLKATYGVYQEVIMEEID
jgi:hypothetical protein